MDTLYIILYFVCGLLSLILFIKVWKMTNNVKKLTNYIVGAIPIGTQIRRTFSDDATVIYTVINRTFEDGKEYLILQTDDPAITSKTYKVPTKTVINAKDGFNIITIKQ